MNMQEYAKANSKLQFKSLGIGAKFAFDFKFGDLNQGEYEKTGARRFKDVTTGEEIVIGSITCPVVRK